MCLCLLLIVIDREKGMPFITSFPEFVISFPFVHPSLYLRSSFVHPIVAGTDLQRIYNGTTWDGLQIAWKGNTMSNRGAYSTKERMPSDIKLSLS